jgi:hypothetical protein
MLCVLSIGVYVATYMPNVQNADYSHIKLRALYADARQNWVEDHRALRLGFSLDVNFELRTAVQLCTIVQALRTIGYSTKTRFAR